MQAGLGAFQVFELAAPRDVGAGRKLDLRGHRFLRVGDIAANIAVAEIDEDIDRELCVLGADAGGTLGKVHLGDLTERHRAAVARRDQHLGRNRLRIAAVVARVTDADGVALAPLDRGGDGLAAERRRDRLLQIADREAVAGEARAVGCDF